jgi:hypothetical protein
VLPPPVEVIQVEQEISPALDSWIGPVALTATVPEALGMVIVLSELEAVPDRVMVLAPEELLKIMEPLEVADVPRDKESDPVSARVLKFGESVVLRF